MDNYCLYQCGLLGEGLIEKGMDGKCWICCLWYGWDFDFLIGKLFGGYEDSGQKVYLFKIEGEDIFVGFEFEFVYECMVMDVMVEIMVNWGVKCVFGMVGYFNFGLVDVICFQVNKGNFGYVGICYEGVVFFVVFVYGKFIGKLVGCLMIVGFGVINLMIGLWDVKVDWVFVLVLIGQV